MVSFSFATKLLGWIVSEDNLLLRTVILPHPTDVARKFDIEQNPRLNSSRPAHGEQVVGLLKD